LAQSPETDSACVDPLIGREHPQCGHAVIGERIEVGAGALTGGFAASTPVINEYRIAYGRQQVFEMTIEGKIPGRG